MQNITPTYLQKGDKVGITAPAKAVAITEISYAIQVLEEWGLEIILGKNLAENELQRAEDLQAMLDSPDIKAILCARGGYGTSKIIDKLNFEKFLQSPKWIVGFSDITVLHSTLHLLGVESIHGTMPALFSKQSTESVESLRLALFGTVQPFALPATPHCRAGKATGQLIGGNLSILVNMLGTPSEVDMAGKVLFLEDVGEYLYHIERMLIQLYRAKKLAHLAGLIIGEFSQIRDQDQSFGKNIHTLINDIVAEYDYPVAHHFPIGHEKENLSLICGRQARLEVSDTLITFESLEVEVKV